MGRKSRHCRDESDPLLGAYSNHIAATSSVRFYTPLHDSTSSSHSPTKEDSGREEDLELQGLSVGDKDSKCSTQTDSTRSSKHFDRYKVHRVSYTPQNHVQVLFRMYGSAYPQVLPFCAANILWAVIVILLKDNHILDLTFHSSVGHSFMGLLVSFLVVSRSKISYDRFMDYRRHLATTYRACREIIQFTTTYTFQTRSAKPKEWRQEVCYRTILLLRVTMDALLWSSTEREKWEEEYFTYKDGDGDDVSEHFFGFRHLTHGRRSMIDEHFRAPISFSHMLRHVIMQHPDYLGYKMAVNEYRDILNFVTIFLDAFHEFRVLTFTPYPFPLVQMTRTFLFFWVYSLPLVLLKEYRFWSSIVILSFVTLGFIGVEYVSMALDDPFGDDTNDVDEHGMALLVYEDIYLAMYRTDGYSAACDLRARVLKRYRQGRALDCYRDDLKGYDFWGQHLLEDSKTCSDDESAASGGDFRQAHYHKSRERSRERSKLHICETDPVKLYPGRRSPKEMTIPAGLNKPPLPV